MSRGEDRRVARETESGMKWFYYLFGAVAVIGIRDGKQISYENFSFIKLPVPPLQEQQKIAEVLTAADADIEALRSKLAHLQQEKKALMQQLLTGKRRVKV